MQLLTNGHSKAFEQTRTRTQTYKRLVDERGFEWEDNRRLQNTESTTSPSDESFQLLVKSFLFFFS